MLTQLLLVLLLMQTLLLMLLRVLMLLLLQDSRQLQSVSRRAQAQTQPNTIFISISNMPSPQCP